MKTLRILAALLLAVGMTTSAHATDPDTDKPIRKSEDVAQGDTPVDPGGLLTLSAVEGETTTPLVINPEGTALMRGSADGTPTTLGIVEGSRVAIPRAADGSCPEVEVGLSDNLNADMVTVPDPSRPRKILAADIRSEMEHAIDPVACEVLITRARGYVSYHKKVVKKRLSGKAKKDLVEAFTEPILPDVPLPTPTPGEDRAAISPPSNAPDRKPKFRATTSGTIEPMSAAEEPRKVIQITWDQCILYEFHAMERRSLYRYSQSNPTRYGDYAYNRKRMKYYEYPWYGILKYSYLGYTHEAYLNYSVSPQSHTTNFNNGTKYAPWLQANSHLMVVRQGGPGFSSSTHLWAAPWGQHNEWSYGRVPSYPYGAGRYLWTWKRGTRFTVESAYWVCS